MTFREILTRIIDETPGALAGSIMGRDGIPIDEYEKEKGQVDLASVAVEFEVVLSQADKIAATLFAASGGGLEELVLIAGERQILFRQVDDEYFLVVALERTGMLGKARYLMGRVLQELRAEL